MLLYNVTVGIDKELEQEWIDWMKQQYIPVVMKTEMFTRLVMESILTISKLV